MKNEMYAELMHAASLLTKAASKLEYSDNLHKEASATAEALVSRGIANADQRDFYKIEKLYDEGSEVDISSLITND